MSIELGWHVALTCDLYLAKHGFLLLLNTWFYITTSRLHINCPTHTVPGPLAFCEAAGFKQSTLTSLYISSILPPKYKDFLFPNWQLNTQFLILPVPHSIPYPVRGAAHLAQS